MSQPDIPRDLLRPAAYPWRPDRVDLIETHISWVFLAGDRVVKVKRPVRLDFVDQSSPARRRAICEDEVRLNRRLADGVYLGVVPITRGTDGLEIDGDGEPVEWATLMRRLPAERMLDALIAAGAAPDDLADRLADRLIPFHLGAARCPGAPGAQATEMAQVLIDNLDELRLLMRDRPFGVELGMLDAAVRGFIARHGDLLLGRARDGWIREGHGDLRAEHISMEPDGAVQVFDCVEFSLGIRCADVASDLAFLLMDLDRLGVHPTVGERLVARYRDGGIALPPALLGLYRAHRALVRAKVDAIRMAESDADDDRSMLGDVVMYLHAAAGVALACAPLVVIMMGLSGTGKSTVARQLARVLGADHHRSDAVRKALAGVEGPAAAAWEAGIYARETTEVTYTRLTELGAASIGAGRPAILDATFLEADRRDAAAAMARAAGVPVLLVVTVTDLKVLERRLAARARRGADPSDADAGVMRRQRAEVAAEPMAVPAGALVARVDTTPEGWVDLDPVLAVLRDAGILVPRIGGEGG